MASQLQTLSTPMPSQFLLILPYVATIIAVAGLVGRVRAPAADGIPFEKVTSRSTGRGCGPRPASMTATPTSPYSHYPVGAAALVDDGRIVTGCNVENASYGVTLCAECGLVSSLAAGGGGRLVAFACVDALGAALMPCGRCRQLLWEHGGPELLIDTPTGILPMDGGAAAGLRSRPTSTHVRKLRPR